MIPRCATRTEDSDHSLRVAPRSAERTFRTYASAAIADAAFARTRSTEILAAQHTSPKQSFKRLNRVGSQTTLSLRGARTHMSRTFLSFAASVRMAGSSNTPILDMATSGSKSFGCHPKLSDKALWDGRLHRAANGPAGCCWVMQPMPPPSSAMKVLSTPTMRRPGNSFSNSVRIGSSPSPFSMGVIRASLMT